MALANFLPKCSSLLKPAVQQVSLRTSMKTSAPLQGFFDFLKPKYAIPEYDEQGELGFPDDDELATGMWKKELEWRNAGIEDPFCIGAITRGDKGSKIDPIMVPGSFESRTMSCRCNEDQHTLFTMWLHQGEPKRCRCGYWHVLYYKEPISDWTLPQ
ncbi:hypothetical protein V9T40_005092 [Parthenolecanium corni]|uniref:Cytochrome c oxidase subunit 5B, mitochondrial n=1 Tax=Parthenolecanium corni TaxID=536013 RepID=A0AAN9TH93_9HEMI